MARSIFRSASEAPAASWPRGAVTWMRPCSGCRLSSCRLTCAASTRALSHPAVVSRARAVPLALNVNFGWRHQSSARRASTEPSWRLSGSRAGGRGCNCFSSAGRDCCRLNAALPQVRASACAPENRRVSAPCNPSQPSACRMLSRSCNRACTAGAGQLPKRRVSVVSSISPCIRAG